MPLFIVGKDVFVWIAIGRKTIEVRKGRAKRGEGAVFRYGRKTLRGKINKIEEGSLSEILRNDNYKLIIPNAKSSEMAIAYFKGLHGTTEGMFTAYYFDLEKNLSKNSKIR